MQVKLKYGSKDRYSCARIYFALKLKGKKRKMQMLRSKAKLTAAIVLVLLMASVTLMAMPVMPVQAQEGAHGGATVGTGSAVSGPLAAGRRVDQTITTEAQLSFRPNPIGLGQALLVNMWIVPSTNNQRFLNGYTVTIVKPDGTEEVIGPLNSYQGDATSWFEYVVDQVGEWKLKFNFAGDWFPNGTYYKGYTVAESPYQIPVEQMGGAANDLGACYYTAASTDWQTLTVQQDMVASWPPAPLPTDYWTRPVSMANREWWTILGNWPEDGYQGGGSTWDALYPDTNPYFADNYNFHPWILAPNTNHIVWKRQGAIAGLTGGAVGIYGQLGSPGGPSVIYEGRCYQTYTKPGVGSVAACYDLRTGGVYYEIPTASGGRTPTKVVYNAPVESTIIVGEIAQMGWSAELIDISGSTLYKVNPYTGVVSNYSIAPLTSTGNYFYNQYNGMSIAVQTAGNATNPQFRLINWTTVGTSTNFTTRILRNTTYSGDGHGTFFAGGVVNDTDRFNGEFQVDFGAGVWCQVDSVEFLNTTGTYEAMVITAYNLYTGVRMWQTSVDMGGLTRGPYSRSDFITDHGKIAVLTMYGTWKAYDLATGRLAWTSERMDYPWGSNSFGAYAVCSAYGMLYRFSYDGVYAFNWDDGKIAWHYVAQSLNPWETPYFQNGTDMYSFNSGGWVADGKMYIANSEHTTSWPITRGWQLHCINVTTGELIWKIVGDATPSAAADGYLAASSSETGYMYSFGKGLSATTVTAPDVAVPLGTGVLIKGTVLDMSPAQPGTPCVSKDSMTTQMQYLHFQYPIGGLYNNETLTGVPVILTAIGSDGTVTDIGTTTTNGYYGTFAYAWTPPKEDTYTIMASFAGDDSYGSSSTATGLLVGPAPASPTPTPTPPEAAPDNTPLLYGILVAVVIAIIIGLLALFRKR
jgi:hypothetical protein